MIHFAVQVKTPPASEPVSLEDVKKHCRVDISDDDLLLAIYIQAARELCETEAYRAFLPTVYTVSYDRFPLLPNSQYSPGNPAILTPVLHNVWPLDPSAWALMIPRSPLISVASIKYYATPDGALTTLDPSGYLVDAASEPARLSPSSGGYWPSAMFRPNAVSVECTAGYADADAVPAAAKMAILLTVAHLYEHRESVSELGLKEMPMGARALLSTIKVPWMY